MQLDHPAYDGLGAEVALPTAAYSAETSASRKCIAAWVSDSWDSTRLSGQPLLAHQLGDLLLAALDRLLAALLGEPLLDLGAGPR